MHSNKIVGRLLDFCDKPINPEITKKSTELLRLFAMTDGSAGMLGKPGEGINILMLENLRKTTRARIEDESFDTVYLKMLFDYLKRTNEGD